MLVEWNNLKWMTDGNVCPAGVRMTDKNVCPTGMRMTDRNVCPTDFRGGFTLIELLVVFAIIAILLAASAPMLRMFTGTRSIEAGQNQVAATLEAARSQAITLHEIRGVLFVMEGGQMDLNASGYPVPSPLDGSKPTMKLMPPGRVKAIIVRASAPVQGDASFMQQRGMEVYLDGAGMEPVVLPQGVLLQTIDNCTLNTNSIRQDDNYIGFNHFLASPANPLDTSIPVGGVILFDADGRLVTMRYGFRLGYVDATGAYRRSELADILFPGLVIDNTRRYVAGAPWVYIGDGAATNTQAAVAPYSNVGLVLCDREQFDAIGTLWDPQFSNVKNVPAGKPAPSPGDEYQNGKVSNHPWGNEEQWLDEHSVPILINRVTGTVIKGE